MEDPFLVHNYVGNVQPINFFPSTPYQLSSPDFLQDPSTVTDLDGEKTVSDAGATKVSVGSRFGLQDLPHFFEAKKWGSSQRPFS